MSVWEEVAAEVVRAVGLHGHGAAMPDGTGTVWSLDAQRARADCDGAVDNGTPLWSLVLLEEVYEALAESDPATLRVELVQVAAVAMRWVQAIDDRGTT